MTVWGLVTVATVGPFGMDILVEATELGVIGVSAVD